MSNYAALSVFYSLPTNTLGYTETHPPVTLSFCVRKTKSGMAIAPNHYIWSSNVQKSAPKGFVVCLVWFGLFPQEQKACHLLKTKTKPKIVSLKILLFFSKSLSTYLMGCIMKRTSIGHLAWCTLVLLQSSVSESLFSKPWHHHTFLCQVLIGGG